MQALLSHQCFGGRGLIIRIPVPRLYFCVLYFNNYSGPQKQSGGQAQHLKTASIKTLFGFPINCLKYSLRDR